MKRWLLACLATLTLLMVVASPAAAGPGGNSNNAAACQKGGWQSLARTEDATKAFLGQGECVSYGAQGGTLVPYAPVVYNPAISVVMAVVYDEFGFEYCAPQVVATGFLPNTVYDVDAAFILWGDHQLFQITTANDGSYSLSSISFTRNVPEATFQISIGGVFSDVVPYTC